MTAVVPEPTTVDPDAPVLDHRGMDDPATDQLVLADLLVEEISIDGMCGVY